MKNLNIKKIISSIPAPAPSDTIQSVISDLQKTIGHRNFPKHQNSCKCQMCGDVRYDQDNFTEQIQKLKSTSLEAAKLYSRMLDGLTVQGAKTLKLYIPDLFFVEGDSLYIFMTSRDGRIVKLSGMTQIKSLYQTVVRLRKQYKSQLQQNFNRKMLDKIDPKFMHIKYYDKIIPSSFHAGVDSTMLQANKKQFRHYVLHKNQKYKIQSIQQHKMNQRQPFCLIVFNDGNSQLLNQKQFQIFTNQNKNKISDQVLFFQGFIKFKQEGQSILFSQFSYRYQQINHQLDKRAETDVMILLGGLTKYDEGYRDIQTVEEIDLQLMIDNPKEYVQLMSYKIIHYLAMASRIYVTRLKLKWIINDMGAVYIQQIMECVTAQMPKRFIRYRLPRKEDAHDFYSGGSNFIQIYRDMKKKRILNTLIIKKDIDNKTYHQLLEIMNPQMKNMNDQRKKIQAARKLQNTTISRPTKETARLSRTIDIDRQSTLMPKRNKASPASTYKQHLNEHPQFVMKNMRYNSVNLGRYQIDKNQKLDKKINNHFVYNMSSQDKKALCSQVYKQPSTTTRNSLSRYFQKQNDKINQSVLYNTFHAQQQNKSKEISNLFKNQKMVSKKLNQNCKK